MPGEGPPPGPVVEFGNVPRLKPLEWTWNVRAGGRTDAGAPLSVLDVMQGNAFMRIITDAAGLRELRDGLDAWLAASGAGIEVVRDVPR